MTLKSTVLFITILFAINLSLPLYVNASMTEFNFDAVKKDGDFFQRYEADIDGDGETETIALQAYNMQLFKENGTEEIIHYSGRLSVLKKGGGDSKDEKIIWQAKPFAKNDFGPRNRVDFFFGDSGLEPIEAAGFITDAESFELISPAMQSDFRPVTYRLIRWDKNKKEFVLSKFGILKGALDNPSEFGWSEYKDEEVEKCSWISKIDEIKAPGVIKVEIWRFIKEKDSQMPMRAIAILKYNKEKEKYLIENWIEKFSIVQ